jgi:hypothetical protein
MVLALLAPVPCCHLGSALHSEHGFKPDERVAFGSNAIDVFMRDGQPALPSGLPVLVYASRPEFGDEAHLFKGRAVGVQARYIKWQPADNRGRHPDKAVRPLSTELDGPAFGFWEITDLRKMAVIRSVNLLRYWGNQKRIEDKPRQPRLVDMPDGFFEDQK